MSSSGISDAASAVSSFFGGFSTLGFVPQATVKSRQTRASIRLIQTLGFFM